MESAGAVKIFNRSIEKNNLIYNEYLGDGDTSSFKDVIESDPYKDLNIKITKLECIGHVQKRMGTRLCKVVKTYKGTNTPLHGRGKLTKSVINSMQNFYSLAIRNNFENLYAMKKAVWAVLFHCTDFDDKEWRHHMCPRDSETWCKYHLNRVHGVNTYVEQVNLSVAVFNILKPTFTDLSSDDLLKKCLHGKTQNANEALNQIIWRRSPKSIFVGRVVLESAVNSSVIEFNEGPNGIFSVLNKFHLTGYVTPMKLNEKKKETIKRSLQKSTDRVKKRRKQLRTIKKGYLDKDDEEKNSKYIPGGF